MKLLCTFFLFTSFIATAVSAQSNAGSAEFAMLHEAWPCELARDSEKQSGLTELRKAVLWNTFGNSLKCLEGYLADPKLKTIQIHLINEVCQRHKNCGEHELTARMTPRQYNKRLVEGDEKLQSKLNEYLKIPSDFLKAKLAAGTECLISPGLESNLSIAGAKKLIEIVRPHFPQCKIVWNPVDSNPEAKPIEGTIYEVHGTHPTLSPACNANLDGIDIDYPERPAILPQQVKSSEIPDYISRYKACQNSFLWIAEFNGIAGKDFIDPRKRTSFPNLKTFNLLNKLIAERS